MVKNGKTVSSVKKKITVKKSTTQKKKKLSPSAKSRKVKPSVTSFTPESKYKDAIKQASDPMFINDFSGRFVEVNDKACESLGYTKKELLRMNLSDLEQDLDVKSVRKYWDKMSDGVTYFLKGHHRRKDGITFPVDVKFQIFTHSGKRLIISFVRDITENIKAEQQKKIEEDSFRFTFDSMLEGAQIIRYDWTYLYINSAAEKQNKRPNSELIGNVYTEMWPGVENTEVFRKMKSCMYDRIPQHFENHFVFPDGSDGWYELSIQPVPEGIFILSYDITERKIAEENYRESRELFTDCTRTVRRRYCLLFLTAQHLRQMRQHAECSGEPKRKFANSDATDLLI